MATMISSFDNTQLFIKVEIPADAKAIAVIVHGLCEHHGRYDYFVEKLHAAGIGTYRFDHRGHGRSEGERTHLNDFNELLDDTHVIVTKAIAENGDLPIFVIGHSMGGFTVSLYGAKYPNQRIRGFVMSGALVKDYAGLIAAVPLDLDPHMPLPNELGAGVCSVPEVVEWYGQDPYNSKTFTTGLCYSINKGIAWFDETVKNFTYPALMLHGELDGLVSTKDSQFLFEHVASKDKQIKIYGNLFHEIFNEYAKDEVIDDLLSWVLRRM
ncbi:lysophospholipase [Chakrabartyella piscis]|uniref:alpha/beta hydrolase n=1 Tax=Chakrabartyella piscis TaxID=2918914 RepID=UPI0029583A98|nr:lysophospholipase [Chakrabartyella piscis]